MAPKLKYNYDIKKISAMEQSGFKLSDIAKMNGWGESSLRRWMKTHWVSNGYIPKSEYMRKQYA